MYGRNGRIGVIELSSSTAATAEFEMVLRGCDDVLAVVSRLRLPDRAISVDALGAMLDSDELELAALQLADASVDVITFACTTGSLLRGPGYDRRLAERIEAATGVRATTTASAVVKVLQAAGVRTVSVGTPYNAELNELERAFLVESGFEVVHIEGLSLRDDLELDALEWPAVRELAESVSRHTADATFLSCTNLPTLPLLRELEALHGRPVVSSNSATIWDCLDLIGIRASIPGLPLPSAVTEARSR
jgi:maleate isomerase